MARPPSHADVSYAGLSAPGTLTASVGRSFRPGLAVRARILLACAALLGVVWTLERPIGPARAPNASDASPESSLLGALAARGFSAQRDSIVWLEAPQGPLALRSAVVIAQRARELPDVHYLEVRATEAGRVLDLWWLTNLTRSSSAAESQLTHVGPFVAFASQVGERYAAISMLDTRGERQELTARWPFYARLQNAITNLQDTGRAVGFGRVRYGLDPAPEQLRMQPSSAQAASDASQALLVVELDDGAITLDPASARVASNTSTTDHANAQLAQKGQPGTITWVVDTVRNLSFVGAAPIEWLEHTVFGLTDRATRAYHDVVEREPSARVGQEARAALSVSVTPEARRRDLLTASDPELRWPPPKLEPVLPDPVSGEGEWLPVVDEMVAQYPGAPPAFYQTFVRVDAERSYTRVYVTLWDPRQLQLNIVMGTQEPMSATGETGQGIVPRDPKVLRRLVAGFNGGFQALHGEFGMMAERRVYLPPKPYAATVAVLEDGRVGLGSWPGPDRSGWDEERANAQIPSDMIAMRQNLTSVVEDGIYNPWKRWWWGAAPVFATEQTFIHRSGLCLTTEGHLAYLWGESMGPDELGRAMQAVRCARGMHLDMNGKHTGFEMYRTFARGDQVPALSRKLDPETEHEGAIEGAERAGFTARAKLAVKTMTPLRFPRYLGRDPRDFFFLTQKPVLPGPALMLGDKAVELSAAGLPHAGWPHAFARARIAENDTVGEMGAWLLRIDPARAIASPIASADLSRPLARLHGVPRTAALGDSADKPLALYVDPSSKLVRYAIGTPPAGAKVLLRGAPFDAAAGASRVLAIDSEGFLLYAEADPGAEGWLAKQLASAGLQGALVLPHAQLALVTDTGQVSVNGDELVAPGTALPPISRKADELESAALTGSAAQDDSFAFMAETRPAADVMFREVTPKPYRFWGWIQGQRVRYFPEGAPRFRAPEDALPLAPLSAIPAGDPGAAQATP